MRVAAIQARSGSTRFPSKVLEPLAGGLTVIGFMLERVALSKRLDRVVVAIPEEDERLASHLEGLGATVCPGSLDDVLDRIYRAVAPPKPDTVVRLTGDCPLVDPALVDHMIDRHAREKLDFLSFGSRRTFPDGLGTEVMSFPALETAWREATDPFEREHVTTFIRRHPERFRLSEEHLAEPAGHIRVTVDYPADLIVVRAVAGRLLETVGPAFGFRDIIALHRDEPDLFAANSAHPAYEDGPAATKS